MPVMMIVAMTRIVAVMGIVRMNPTMIDRLDLRGSPDCDEEIVLYYVNVRLRRGSLNERLCSVTKFSEQWKVWKQEFES